MVQFLKNITIFGSCKMVYCFRGHSHIRYCLRYMFYMAFYALCVFFFFSFLNIYANVDYYYITANRIWCDWDLLFSKARIWFNFIIHSNVNVSWLTALRIGLFCALIWGDKFCSYIIIYLFTRNWCIIFFDSCCTLIWDFSSEYFAVFRKRNFPILKRIQKATRISV